MTKALRHVNGVLAAILLFVIFGAFTARNWSSVATFMILATPLVLTWNALAPTSIRPLRWAALASQAIIGIGGLYLITEIFGSDAGMLRKDAQAEAVIGALAMLLAAINATALKNALQLKPSNA